MSEQPIVVQLSPRQLDVVREYLGAREAANRAARRVDELKPQVQQCFVLHDGTYADYVADGNELIAQRKVAPVDQLDTVKLKEAYPWVTTFNVTHYRVTIGPPVSSRRPAWYEVEVEEEAATG